MYRQDSSLKIITQFCVFLLIRVYSNWIAIDMMSFDRRWRLRPSGVLYARQSTARLHRNIKFCAGTTSVCNSVIVWDWNLYCTAGKWLEERERSCTQNGVTAPPYSPTSTPISWQKLSAGSQILNFSNATFGSGKGE